MTLYIKQFYSSVYSEMITAFPPNFRAGRLRRCPATDHAAASGTSHPRHPVRSPDGLRLWTPFSLKSQSLLRLRTVSPSFCQIEIVSTMFRASRSWSFAVPFLLYVLY